MPMEAGIRTTTLSDQARGWLAAVVLFSLAVPAQAQDTGAQDIGAWLASGSFELRGGPMLHGLEADSRLISTIEQHRIEDVSVELIYSPPTNEVLYWLGSPRAVIGGNFNLLGYENNLHLNLNWHLPVFTTPVWVEGGLGGSYLTGYLENPPPGYRALGCHTTFFLQASVGADIGDNWTAAVSWEHSSHWWMCGQTNQGLNSLGIKIGYKF